MSNKNFHIVLKKILLVLGVFYTMYSNHVHPHSSWLFLSLPPPLPYLPFFVSFKKSISKEICAAQIFLDVWSSPGVTRSYTCREIVPSSHSSCWLPVASWPGWDCVLSFRSLLGLACLGLGMAMRSFVQLSDVFRRHCLLVVVYFFRLLHSSRDLFSIGPSALGGGVQHMCSS